MSVWAFDQIKKDWLGDSIISTPDSEVVMCFDLIDRIFGASWIEAQRIRYGTGRGVAPVLHVIATARMLNALDGVMRCGPLVTKIRDGDRSGRCEGFAAVILRRRSDDLEIEYEPEITVSGRETHPDFRVRHGGGDDWTHIEVVAPDKPKAQAPVDRSLAAGKEVLNVPGTHGIEIFLRRATSTSEDEVIRDIAEGLAGMTGERAIDLPDDLGRVFRTEGKPGRVAMDDHGEPSRPGLGQVETRMGPDGHRWVATRVAFSDPRATKILSGKARQLPQGTASLVMMFTNQAVGAWRDWPDQITDRFRPTQHTRVGGVMLVQSGIWQTTTGECLKLETRLVPNPYSALASWLVAPSSDQFCV